MSSESDSFNKLGEQDMASGKDTSLSDQTSLIASSGDASSVKEGGSKQKLISDQGYDGAYLNWDNQAREGLERMPYSGVHTDNGSLVYYVPNYNPYSPGGLMTADGQCAGQQQYFPTRHIHTNVSYGSRTMPIESWGTQPLARNPAKGAIAFGDQNCDVFPSPTTSAKSKSSSSAGKQCALDRTISRAPALPLISKQHISPASSSLPNHPLKSPNKTPQLEFDIQKSSAATRYYHKGNSSLVNNGQGRLFPTNSVTSFRLKGQTSADNERFNMIERLSRRRDFEASSGLTRGPRAKRGNVSVSKSSSDEKGSLNSPVRRDKYNLPDFKTKYEEAKFFMIKSFSEDDVHKSIKYNVWASTPIGNKKLDAAFRVAELRVEVTRCPIFLFFSVNASGQFVGLAEMTGPVDFKKTMDFWQQDKWSGFFPLKWHIIKDIPNGLFRNITLENNDNRAVTYSRDTQEIKLPQGLKMLQMFKNYQAETSILDDFGFYEEKEKSLRASRACSEVSNKNTSRSLKHSGVAAKKVELSTSPERRVANQTTSLITLTKNLSLNARVLNGRSQGN